MGVLQNLLVRNFEKNFLATTLRLVRRKKRANLFLLNTEAICTTLFSLLLLMDMEMAG